MKILKRYYEESEAFIVNDIDAVRALEIKNDEIIRKNWNQAKIPIYFHQHK